MIISSTPSSPLDSRKWIKVFPSYNWIWETPLRAGMPTFLLCDSSIALLVPRFPGRECEAKLMKTNVLEYVDMFWTCYGIVVLLAARSGVFVCLSVHLFSVLLRLFIFVSISLPFISGFFLSSSSLFLAFFYHSLFQCFLLFLKIIFLFYFSLDSSSLAFYFSTFFLFSPLLSSPCICPFDPFHFFSPFHFSYSFVFIPSFRSLFFAILSFLSIWEPVNRI